jgi:hypothetical protein
MEASSSFLRQNLTYKYWKTQKIKREVRRWNKLQKMSAFHLSRVS